MTTRWEIRVDEANPEEEIPLTENGRIVLERRYLRKGPDGRPVETIPQMFRRVARAIAEAEKELGGDPALWEERFYQLLTSLRFLPNSPTFTGAGTPLGQLAACFTPEMRVMTDRGLKRIADLRPGDRVLTHRGRYRPVLQTSRRFYRGPLKVIQVRRIGQPIRATPEHPFLTPRGWVMAADLRPGDWAAVGFPKGILPVEPFDLAEAVYGEDLEVQCTSTSIRVRRPAAYQNSGRQARWIPRYIPVNAEIARLCGYYVAEGTIGPDLEYVRFTFSTDETDYQADVSRILDDVLGFTPTFVNSRRGNWVHLDIYSRALANWFFAHFGHHSYDKRIPIWMQYADFRLQEEFLTGLLRGDGFYSEKKYRVEGRSSPKLFRAFRITLSNPTLIYQTWQMLLRLGYEASVRRVDTTYVTPKAHEAAQIIMPPLRSRQLIEKAFGAYLPVPASTGNDILRNGDHAYLKIENVGTEEYEGFVYNCEVEEDHSYVVEGVVVHNCFVLPLEDDMGKIPGGIFQTLRDAALIQQTGGGNGFSFSRLRPKNAVVFSSMGRATGPVGFLRVYDRAFGEIAQGGSRRGANMAVLRVDHPDIEEFITCKTDENAITNFNISVGITDAFMRAVENDEEWELRFPDVLHPAYRNFRGTLEDAERAGIPIRVYKRVRARDLFRKIATQAHHNGEPGVLFLDTANRSNPVPHLYTLEATNPCVTGDTLVATPQGWRYAAEIRVGDEICTVLGTGRVERIEVYKQRPVYRVFLSDGGVIKVTAAHQFHVRDSRTKFYEPRRVDQLKPGDWVRVFPARMPNNPVPDKPPHLSDREFGFLIGVLLGDGCYTERALSRNVVRVSAHADEEEWNAVVQEAFQKLGATHFVTYVNSGSHSMMMDPKPGPVIADWVRTLLLPLARSPEKRLPLAYINSNREFLEGLLDGLFSTDGSVDLSSNRPLLRFHTSSEELARQVRLILLMFGIHARIHRTVRKRHALNGREIRHDRPKYDVVISGASLGRFVEQIRLSHPEKQRRLEEAALRCNFTGGNWAAQVVKIEFAGYETVYDLYEPRSDTWITEGYVSRGCGEQWLGPYENCCLGSVNLARHVKYVNGKAEVDWEKLRETVEWATRFLDNVVQVNQYVPAVPQLKEAAFKTRRIGLGFMGLADLMYHLRIRYGSEEGQELAAQIAEFIRYHAMRTSIELARERGPFPAIRGSIYDPEDLKWEPPKPLKPYTRDWGRPPLDWNAIVEGIRRHGIRNAAQTTVAPTGCLVAGTMIITDRGLLPIEALGDPNGPQWQDVDWVVASEGGPRRATKFYVNGVAHTLRVVTRRGYVLQGTDGHRIRVWENGKWVWRRLDELKPSMRIPIVAGMIGTPQRVELDIPANKDPRCTDVRFPSHVTPELAYLVGFFMGDGSLKQRSMRLSVSDPELKEELVRRIREVFGVEPRLLQDPRSRRLWSVEIHSKLLVEFWRKNGFNKIPARPGHRGKGYQPHVPIKILQTNDPRIYGAFLAGLLDADGMIQRGHLISWSTTCREFHDQVKAMLLALGVLTTSDVQQTGISGAPLYRLRTAHAEATRRLVQQLELLVRLRVPGSNGHVRRSYLRDTIPLSDWEKNSLLAIAGSTREQMRVWGWRQRGLANRETAIAFVQAHRGDLLHAGLESFVQAVEQPVFYDEIVAIEDGGWRETYDLSVPGTHAYIANGFVSHNTISTVAGCEGYGCEPVFALAYIRYVHEAEGRLELRYVSPLFMRALKEAGLDEETRARIIEEVLRKGTCQHIQELPDWIRHTFVVAQDLTPEEHVWMQASIQAFIDNSISKCVTGDTMVLTAQGLLPIAEISPMRLPDQFEPLDLDVVTPYGIKRAAAFYYGGRREIRRIHLAYGYQIAGTPNHRVHVLGPDGRVCFRRLDELQPGDLVVLYVGQQQFGPAGQPLPPYSGAYRTRSKPVRWPERMSPDLAYVLGWITSEGSITANGVTIAHHSRKLLEGLARLFEDLFGLKGHILKDKRREVYTLQVNSRALRHWLLNDLGMKAGARNKIIPLCVLKGSREEIKAFLKGLLQDAFMSQDGRMFGITLSSLTLIRQLQALFLNLGVLSRLHRSGPHAWGLTVSGKALERLAEFLEFEEPWKAQRLSRRHEGRRHRLFNYSELMPSTLTTALRAMQESSSRSLRSLYPEDGIAYQRARVALLKGHRLDRETAQAIYTHFHDVAHPYARAFFEEDREDRFFVEVERVESDFAEVFDLYVPDSHTFIANGLCNHNTINFPATATVEDVERAYMMAWKLGCKGLTVYVAGSRQKEVLETLETKAKKEQKEAAMVPAQPTLPQPVGPTVRPRPQKLAGVTYRIATPVGTAFITLNENGEGQPFEVFLNVGKAGSDIAAVAEAIGRLISLLLRLPSPVPPAERLRQVVDQLQGIGGGRALGFGPERVRSLPDGIARVLAEYLAERGLELPAAPAPAVQPALPLSEPHPGQEEPRAMGPVGDICPQCGEATLLEQEGCRTCYNCGYSEC
ncbi:LAGLIDADG family homing endonuclease [Thermoflexus hugenholtzii]